MIRRLASTSKRRRDGSAEPSAGADRMPQIPPGEMTEAQKRAAEQLASGPRGGVVGPFIAALRSPEFMSRLEQLGVYLRYDNVLGRRLTELVILLTAREWTQPFEWATHVASAADHGIDASVIDAVREGRRPERLREDECIAYEFFTELHAQASVSDSTYARAVAAFGEQGVIDLIGVIGYYTTLAMILNVARTPAPAPPGPPLGALRGD